MKTTTTLLSAAVVAGALSSPVLAQSLDQIPELKYDTEIIVSNLNMPPNVHLGEAAGVSIDSKGNIYVYSRTGGPGDIDFRRSAQLFEFDSTGKFIREIGGKNNYIMGWAHSVRIDSDDNIWIVDNGTNLVGKFDQQGRVVMALGRRKETVQPLIQTIKPDGRIQTDSTRGPTNDGIFWEPTDIAFDSKGNLYVSDGYKNTNVQKFTKDGEFITRWGTPGSGPGQMKTPHGIAVDKKDNVYVADRGNNRIQVFDSNGKYLRETKLDIRYPKDVVLKTPALGVGQDGRIGSLFPNSICISKGPNPVIYANDLTPSVVLKISLDGKVLGRFGSEGRQKGQFAWMHELACGKGDNEVYLTEMINYRVSKVTLK